MSVLANILGNLFRRFANIITLSASTIPQTPSSLSARFHPIQPPFLFLGLSPSTPAVFPFRREHYVGWSAFSAIIPHFLLPPRIPSVSPPSISSTLSFLPPPSSSSPPVPFGFDTLPTGETATRDGGKKRGGEERTSAPKEEGEQAETDSVERRCLRQFETAAALAFFNCCLLALICRELASPFP